MRHYMQEPKGPCPGVGYADQGAGGLFDAFTLNFNLSLHLNLNLSLNPSLKLHLFEPEPSLDLRS